MRVLVTGGAGYIGSHTMIEVLAADHDVMVVDNFANSAPEALTRVARLSNRSFGTAEANIGDAARMTEICRDFRPEAVLHFAGLKAVGESIDIPLTYYRENVVATINLLQVLDAVDCRHIVFSSSATVYGMPQYLPCDENHPLDAINPYGRTKQMIEMIIADWAAAATGRSAMLLRYFNPVGAHVSGQIGEDPLGRPNNLMPLIARVAGGRLPHVDIFGDDYDTPDGTGVRDYIHVTDLARGHVRALEHVAVHDGVEAVNLGTGRGYSVKEVIAAFEAASGLTIPARIAPRRAGDSDASYASTDKAKSLLGWQAEHGLAEMCADTWRWQSQNPKGYAG